MFHVDFKINQLIFQVVSWNVIKPIESIFLNLMQNSWLNQWHKCTANDLVID
jgi:hypothetical protein